jgi:alkyl sulfatase BDS1-like metallo-beta-lactamase superfamily hydrolase
MTATHHIADANAALRMRLPFSDNEDFDDARRGWIGSLTDPVIRATDGRVAWYARAYGFLDSECPPTVNPSLWRQSQSAAIHGLFEVADGIYQVRGLDLSRGRGARPLPRASRRPPGHGAPLHA